MSKYWGRNAQVCAGSCTWTSLLSSHMVPFQAQLTPKLAFLLGLGALGLNLYSPLNSCWPFPPFLPHLFAVTKVELMGPFLSKDWPLITARGQKIKKINYLCLGPLVYIFLRPLQKVTRNPRWGFDFWGWRSSALPTSPTVSTDHITFAPVKAPLLSPQRKQTNSVGPSFDVSEALRTRTVRQTFLSAMGRCCIAVLWW